MTHSLVTIKEWQRHNNRALPQILQDYGVRYYTLELDRSSYLEVFVGREPLGPKGKLQWHLSIAQKAKHVLANTGTRLPTWDEIKEARYRFCPCDISMAIILPPQDEYVNIHETTMHLFEVR